MDKHEKSFNGIWGLITILKYLLLHEHTYRKEIWPAVLKLAGLIWAQLIIVWGFDLNKVTSTGIMSPESQYRVRWLCSILLFLISVASLILLTRHHVKKWQNLSNLNSKDLKKLIESQTSQPVTAPDR
jgi:hypothetical protein